MSMPLTFPAHQAFVLPLKQRWPHRFDGVALVISAGAPDLGYALPFLPVSSHSLAGVMVFALPFTLVYSWLLRRFGLPGLARLLPPRSAWARYGSIRPRPPAPWITIWSALLGAGSHVGIDSFTHGSRWGARTLGLDKVLFNAPNGDFTLARAIQYSGHTIGSAVGLWLLWRLAQGRPALDGSWPVRSHQWWAFAGTLLAGLAISVTLAVISPTATIFVAGTGLVLTLLAASVAVEFAAPRQEHSRDDQGGPLGR